MNRIQVITPDRVKWREEAAEMQANPGEWFVLTERETLDAAWSFAQGIKNGRRKAFLPVEEYEACTRDKSVLVRFVGGGDGQ